MLQGEEQIEQFKAGMAVTVPIGRMGNPDEVAKVAVSSLVLSCL